MNAQELIVVYSALAGASLLLLMLQLRKENKNRLDDSFRFVVCMLLGWQTALLLQLNSRSAAAYQLFYDLPLPFVALTSLAWFLYIIRFYALDSYFPKKVMALFFVVPAFTAALAITTRHHSFIRTGVEIPPIPPVPLIQLARGPWFWYHAAYCYVFVVAAFIVALYQHTKILKPYRMSSTLLLSGLAVTLLGNVLVLTTNMQVDISLVAASISSLLLYPATTNNQSLSFLLQARRAAFDCIDKAIVILDNDMEIVSINKNARILLGGIAEKPENLCYRTIEERLLKRAENIYVWDNEKNGVDYYLPSEEVYNFRRKPILDNKQKAIGTMLIITDVKENRQLIDYLDNVAGLDTLTGVLNLRAMREGMAELNVSHFIPVTVLSGDLNDLKKINDKFGHQQGDIYIRVAAETLRKICPPNARVARVGGDEFLILIPNYTEKQAKELIGVIHTSFRRLRGYSFVPSIALGYAIKEHPSQDLQEVYRTADANMYMEKRLQKAGSEAGIYRPHQIS